MFIIFIGFWLIRMWMDRHQIKVLSKNCLESVKMAGAACLMNPLGIFVAVRFNLSIFLKVSDSPSNIDAWGGNVKSLPGISAVLMGGIDVGNLGNYPHIISIYSLLLLLASGLLIGLFFIAQKRMYSKKLAILWTLIFFSGYELYFQYVRLAYGEFKHLSSISIFFTIYCFYYFFIFVSSLKRSKLIFSFGCFSFLCFLILNIISICVRFPINSSFYIGSQLLKLQEIEAYIPSGTSVTIVGDDYAKQHGAIYALKDFPVRLAGTHSNSYYTDGGIPYTDEWGEYALLPMISGEITVRNGYEYVWDNKLYYLFKNTNLLQ